MNKKYVLITLIIIVIAIGYGLFMNITGYMNGYREGIHKAYNRQYNGEYIFNNNITKYETINKSQENLQKVIKIERLAKYSAYTHTYIKHNYDCSDFSIDLWNRLYTYDINSTLAVRENGNSSHMWVMAEIDNTTWVAIEATTGNLVFKEDEPSYYNATHYFSNPKEFTQYMGCNFRG